MSRRQMRRAASPHARRNRALGLGVAVPAVVSVGALPAFAAHSATTDDEDVAVDSMSMDEEEVDEFAEFSLIDADEDIPEGAEQVEDDYDPYAEVEDDEAGDVDGEAVEAEESDGTD